MGNAVDITAPADEAEGTQSRVLRWLKAPGDRVMRDEPLIELETDKVTVEVPSPADGVLSEIFKQEEEDVAPGDRLGRIDASAELVTPVPVAPAAARAAPAESPGFVTAQEAAPVRSGLLSPAVRRLIAEHGLRAEELAGSGAGGRITVDDVLAHVRARPTDRERPAPPAAPRSAPTEEAGIRRVPHSALRRRIAEHMVTSLLHTAPHVTTVFEADFGAVLAHRERCREAYADRGAPLTLTSYVIAACVDAIRAVPETNARWTEEALEVLERIDIGVGTALSGGALIVPVIRDVGSLTLEEIARRLGDLTTRAREDRLTPTEVRGGTFTISNHGVSGSLLAAPIVINQPQSAILGVGKLERRAVVVGSGAEERVVIRPRCYLTLTIDHRVMDGQRANAFMDVLVRRLAEWPAGG
jgi:2-oxoglutarate dehydrogenase E2 component (dihydrolipoamide succinyltransferase)